MRKLAIAIGLVVTVLMVTAAATPGSATTGTGTPTSSNVEAVRVAGRSIITAASAGATFSIVDLGTLGGAHSSATAVNSFGQIVGTAGTDASLGTHAALWSPPTVGESEYTVTDVGSLGANSAASDINDSGQIVGSAYLPLSGLQHAVLWSPPDVPGESFTITDLGTLPGGRFSEALGINNAGQIVGYSSTPTTTEQAVLWSPPTVPDGSYTIADLDSMIGEFSTAFAINDEGQITGHAVLGGGFTRPVLWTQTAPGAAYAMTVLTSPAAGTGAGMDINFVGQIAGAIGSAPAQPAEPVLWSPPAASDDTYTAVHLPTLGGDFAAAEGISSWGDVAGWSYLPGNFAEHAIVWQPSETADGDFTLTDLGSLGGPTSRASEINDGGVIVGAASKGDVVHAVAWLPSIILGQ